MNAMLTRFLSERRSSGGVTGSDQCLDLTDPALGEIYREIARASLDEGSRKQCLAFAGGALEPGIYTLSWAEFERIYSLSARREALFNGLRDLAAKLLESGCRRIYIGGSFVSAKSDPADFDGCFSVDGIDWPHLMRLEPRLAMENKTDAGELQATYGGVLEPMRVYPAVGASMLEVLQYDTRTSKHKGIVELCLE